MLISIYCSLNYQNINIFQMIKFVQEQIQSNNLSDSDTTIMVSLEQEKDYQKTKLRDLLLLC